MPSARGFTHPQPGTPHILSLGLQTPQPGVLDASAWSFHSPSGWAWGSIHPQPEASRDHSLKLNMCSVWGSARPQPGTPHTLRLGFTCPQPEAQHVLSLGLHLLSAWGSTQHQPELLMPSAWISSRTQHGAPQTLRCLSLGFHMPSARGSIPAACCFTCPPAWDSTRTQPGASDVLSLGLHTPPAKSFTHPQPGA
jgi:hypothetical protein